MKLTLMSRDVNKNSLVAIQKRFGLTDNRLMVLLNICLVLWTSITLPTLIRRKIGSLGQEKVATRSAIYAVQELKAGVVTERTKDRTDGYKNMNKYAFLDNNEGFLYFYKVPYSHNPFKVGTCGKCSGGGGSGSGNGGFQNWFREKTKRTMTVNFSYLFSLFHRYLMYRNRNKSHWEIVKWVLTHGMLFQWPETQMLNYELEIWFGFLLKPYQGQYSRY